jgi:Transposase, Mutator family
MRDAYHADSAILAQAQLEALAKELERTHPGAAASLREGLAETLTVLRLGVSPTLARTLCSTNSIESMMSIARNHSMNVKNWQNGNMALRWCAAGMLEASKQFRRVNGHLHRAHIGLFTVPRLGQRGSARAGSNSLCRPELDEGPLTADVAIVPVPPVSARSLWVGPGMPINWAAMVPPGARNTAVQLARVTGEPFAIRGGSRWHDVREVPVPEMLGHRWPQS